MKCVALITGLALCGGAAAAADPEPKELVAGYRRNLEAFRTLEVHLRQEHIYTDDWFENRLRAAQRLEREADDDQTLPERRDDLRKQAHAQRTFPAANRVPTVLYQLYQTDRAAFGLRVAPPNWEPADLTAPWRVPSDPLTPAALTNSLRDYYILTYDGNPANGFRTWNDRLNAPMMRFGRVAIGNAPTEYNHFPPLGVSRAAWGGHWHPIDEFFALPVDEMKVVGHESIGGHATIVLEHRHENSRTESYLTPDERKSFGPRVRHFQVARAAIDPARGFLPLRIDWDSEFQLDGKTTLPAAKLARWGRVLEVEKIVQVPGSGFYPTDGVIREYGLDPAWEGKRPTFADAFAGKLVDAPMTLYEETRWHVANVSAPALSPSSFSFTYPNGTQYLDERRGRYVVAGKESIQEQAARIPWFLSGGIVLAWVVFGLVIFVRAFVKRRRLAAARWAPANAST